MPQSQQSTGFVITMMNIKDSKSDLATKDIYNDIVARFDATQHPQIFIHQIAGLLVQETYNLKVIAATHGQMYDFTDDYSEEIVEAKRELLHHNNLRITRETV